MSNWWESYIKQKNFTSLMMRRLANHYRILALLRIFVVLVVIFMLLFVRNYHLSLIGVVLALLSIIYVLMVYLHPGLNKFFSSRSYFSSVIDMLAVFIACYLTGGLESPYIYIFFLTVMAYAVGPSNKEFLYVTVTTIILLFVLHAITSGEIISLINILVRLVVFSIFLRMLIYNDAYIITSFASRDGLTNVYTHQYFFDQLYNLVSDSSKTAFSLIILDLDNFKQINDNYGHIEGDRILKQVAKTITEQVRNTDIVARYGGDEFAIILPGADKQLGDKVVKRLRNAIIKLGPFESVSIGMSHYPEEARDVNTLVTLADQRMYSFKNPARNHMNKID
ncbi:MAG: diguanylate cyclase [Syntrophomonadaceae bacterium]|jgi:diguanylate cyclase (GGDEF)-like protein